jgi:hypothetical protein
MASTASPTPWPLRLLDSFLQERNIRWLLAAGAVILLASSLMLISNHWGTYTPTWQYLIMLAYTGLIHIAAGWTATRLSLPRTAVALRALTVLLIPVLFLALAWLTLSGESLLAWPLLLLTTVLALPIASQHFSSLLQGVPGTYLVCYMLLAVSGALLAWLPDTLAPLALAVLWLLVTVGTVKINRHLFWLHEQTREPRIFAFFPVALLIGQLLTLSGLHLAALWSLHVSGLLMTLLAVPILLTADAISQVYRQRSGGLIRQQPVIVAVPLLVGLGLCSIALSLLVAALFVGAAPLLIMPTALLVTLMIGGLAWRSDQAVLAWIAYGGLWLLAGVQWLLYTPLPLSVLSLVWTLMAIPLLPLASRLTGAMAQATHHFAVTVLLVQALLALGVYAPSLWIAGALAVVALYRLGAALRGDHALALLTWQLLGQGSAWQVGVSSFGGLWLSSALPIMPWLAISAALLGMVWQQARTSLLAEWQSQGLRVVTAVALLACLELPVLNSLQLTAVSAALLLTAGAELQHACRERSVARTWIGLGLAASVLLVLWWHGQLTISGIWGPWLMVLSAVLLAGLAHLAAYFSTGGVVLRQALTQIALALPLLAATVVLWRHLSGWPPVVGGNSLLVLCVAGGYGGYGYSQARKGPVVLALVLINLLLAMLWLEFNWHDPQLYLIPLGLTLLSLRWLLAAELPENVHQPLVYLGALIILLSPLWTMLSGSWLPMFTLMLLAVAVMLLGIALRTRALLYTGGGFLLADVLTMVVRGGIDHPSLLWLAGLLLGLSVLSLGAVAEQHRERLITRLQQLAAHLSTWQ